MEKVFTKGEQFSSGCFSLPELSEGIGNLPEEDTILQGWKFYQRKENAGGVG